MTGTLWIEPVGVVNTGNVGHVHNARQGYRNKQHSARPGYLAYDSRQLVIQTDDRHPENLAVTIINRLQGLKG